MDWLKEYKDYFILVTAFATLITVWIGYILNRSLKKQEVFYQRTEESIKTILGPMNQEVQSITEEDHKQLRYRKLDQFIEKYNGAESPLFLSPSRDLLKQFAFVVQEYKLYNKVSSQENHNALWVAILNLQELVDKKFNEYTDFVFKHYDWKYEAEKKNIIIRFLIYTFKLITNVTQGLSQVVLCCLASIILVDVIFYLFTRSFLIKPYMLGGGEIIAIIFLIFPASWYLTWIDENLFGSKSKKKEIMKRNDKLISKYIRKSPHLFLNSATPLDEIEQNASNKDDLVPNQNK